MDGESKAINYLLHGEYELNKTSWSKLQKKYNISRNKTCTALEGKGKTPISAKEKTVKPETAASTPHSETVND